jgi:hypothetical protein
MLLNIQCLMPSQQRPHDPAAGEASVKEMLLNVQYLMPSQQRPHDPAAGEASVKEMSNVSQTVFSLTE